jgi:hypothetical protein
MQQSFHHNCDDFMRLKWYSKWLEKLKRIG